MAARGTIDEETRGRVVAWLRREQEDQGIASIRELARRLGLSHSYLARVLSGSQAPGLDLVLRFTRTFGLSADRVLEEDPPRRYFVASEPIAGAKGRSPRRRPGARRIDAERWLARARALRKRVKGVVTDEDVGRWKNEGRP
ncbi:MAG TPA: helix-turn-helix transcriptional regulator [Anaeromyxobacter sp.]|nr:helix-turn-helix transcriptional regulator [Anaeromyxobacter sp.]